MPRRVNPIEIARFMNTVAQSPASALLLDYDRTLAPFCLNRQQALPYPGVTALLRGSSWTMAVPVWSLSQGGTLTTWARCSLFTPFPKSGDAMDGSG